jgi:hypothetical protein
MSIEVYVECDECGAGLETIREFNNELPFDGFTVTVRPCEHCLQKVIEEELKAERECNI